MQKRKLIFLDRDGVINKDPGGWTEHSYVTRWDDFIFLPNVLKALKELTLAGYDIVTISNQAGISKGLYSKESLDEVNSRMLKEIKKSGAKVKKTYYCLHQTSDNCQCRKPKPGMFKRAQRELGRRITDSYFIGDNQTDVIAGHDAGLKTILVLSGKSSRADVSSWATSPDHILDDLYAAVKFVIKSEQKPARAPATMRRK